MNGAAEYYQLAPKWAKELEWQGLVTFQEIEDLLRSDRGFGRDANVYVSRLTTMRHGNDDVFYDDGMGSVCINILPDGTLGLFYWGWGDESRPPTKTKWVLHRDTLAFARRFT